MSNYEYKAICASIIGDEDIVNKKLNKMSGWELVEVTPQAQGYCLLTFRKEV